MKANAKGEYAFASYKPKFYSIPIDGPVGDLIRATTNNHMRPAHMHAIVSAPGYQQVITHVFVEGDPHLDSDAVYAVKDSLIAKYKKVNDAAEAKKLGMPNPFLRLDWDFRLSPDKGVKAQEDRRERRARMIWRVRRVLTGHDADGRSTFIADGTAPNMKEMPSFPGLALTDLWETKARRSNAAMATPPTGRSASSRRRTARSCASSSSRRTRRARRTRTARRDSRPSAPATPRTGTRPIR